jgi:hypothetical protein
MRALSRRPQCGAGWRQDPHSVYTGLGTSAPRSLGGHGRCGLGGHAIPDVARPGPARWTAARSSRPGGATCSPIPTAARRSCCRRSAAGACSMPVPASSSSACRPRRRPARRRRHAGRVSLLQRLPRACPRQFEGASRRLPGGGKHRRFFDSFDYFLHHSISPDINRERRNFKCRDCTVLFGGGTESPSRFPAAVTVAPTLTTWSEPARPSPSRWPAGGGATAAGHSSGPTAWRLPGPARAGANIAPSSIPISRWTALRRQARLGLGPNRCVRSVQSAAGPPSIRFPIRYRGLGG